MGHQTQPIFKIQISMRMFGFKKLQRAYQQTISSNDSTEINLKVYWNLPTETFWVGNNTLYISLLSIPYSDESELVYLKITMPD